jgi:hypothetical protein
MSPATRLEAELVPIFNAVAVVVVGNAWGKSLIPTLVIAGAAGLVTRQVGLSIIGATRRPAWARAKNDRAA